MKRLPPLRAVRAFESCYRLRSFSRAARALNVQQPAISHQIRLLEEDLQCRLFIKKGKNIEATPEADLYYETIAASLNEIATISEKIRKRHKSKEEELVIATYPGLATYWLLSRIERLRRRLPQLKVRIMTVERDSDLDLSQVDCAILFGNGHWNRYECHKLIEDRIQAIATPQIVKQYNHLPPENFLAKAPIIYLEDLEHRWTSWEEWRDNHAPEQKFINISLSVTNYGLAINQALLGYGVILGWECLLNEYIDQGILAKFDYSPIISPKGYYLVGEPYFFKTKKADLLLQFTQN